MWFSKGMALIWVGLLMVKNNPFVPGKHLQIIYRNFEGKVFERHTLFYGHNLCHTRWWFQIFAIVPPHLVK